MLYFTDAFVPEEEFEVPFGKARVCTQGDDITIVGISNMLVEALRARELLAEIGIHAEVIDPISLVPLDIDTIVKSVRRTGRLLVVDNAWTSCGASAEIVARVVEQRRQRQADPGAAHGIRADDLSDHAGAGAGILPRSLQDRADGLCHGAARRIGLAARRQSLRACLSEEVPRAILSGLPIQYGTNHVL